MSSAYCSAALALTINSLVLDLVFATIRAFCLLKRYFLALATTALRSANLVYELSRSAFRVFIAKAEEFILASAVLMLVAETTLFPS